MWHLFLLISCVSAGSLEDPARGRPTVRGGLEYGKICHFNFSNTIAMIPNVKAEVTCQAECQQVGGCSHFTFYISSSKPSKTSCVLLSSCNTTSTCSNNPGCKHAVSGLEDPARGRPTVRWILPLRTGSRTLPPRNCGGLEYGKICQINFSNTIAMIPNVKDEGTCQAECQQVGGCSHFTFYISSGRPAKTSCVLLSSCNTTSACSNNPGCKHALSGPRTPAIAEDCCSQFHQKACKDQIIDRSYKIASPEQCQNFCLETPQCKFFTQYNGDFCFLHTSCDEVEPCSVCTTGPASPSLDQCQETGPQETLLMGGWTSARYYSTSVELEKRTQSCLPDMPELPVGRHYAASALMGRTILYCGGYSGTAPYYHSECYSYLLAKPGAAWKTAAAMKHPRRLFSLEVIQGKAYAIGGDSDIGSSVTGYTVEVLTPGERWRIAENMRMPGYRYAHCSAKLDSRIVVIGGYYAGSSYSRSVIQFDLNAPSNGWTYLTNTNYRRQYHACQAGSFQGNRGVFVTGGSNSDASLVEFFVDSLNKWRNLPAMKTKRYYHTASYIGNMLFVHGGSGAEAKIEGFNTTWTANTNLRISRQYHTSVNIPEGMLTCK